MAEVASMILSPFLEEFFRKLASGDFEDFFQRRKLSDGLLRELKSAFVTINAVVEDAEELVVTKPTVKDWLDDLKDAVYDAELVLDEIATEALQSELSELDAGSPLSAAKVQKSISDFYKSFVKDIEPKIKKVIKKLDILIAAKDAIGLKEGVGGRPLDRITTSLVEESDICGRANEKEEIIKMLLSDDPCNSEMGVVAIIGMGGLGKTTLAHLVFNDEVLKQHFNFHAWVCVSDQFDLVSITKTILKRVAPSCSDKNDLGQLQSTLKQNLTGKRFLFVLDDVWNEKDGNWRALIKPFTSGVKGNRIIVTTRNSHVASTVHASFSYFLDKLRGEYSWSLFIKHAFNNDESSADSQLKRLGEQILEKCGGIPLAIKTIGAVLRSKLDVDEWDKILKSDLWDPLSEVPILPALKLSYKYLPSHVKRCFAYCSIFPKDYLFDSERLILLWMGEGFLHESRYKTKEEIGKEYFSILVSRSFFQQSSDDKSLFIMHDLLNDLASFVSGQVAMRYGDDRSYETISKVRHLSYDMEEFDCFKKFEPLKKAKNLCTFMPLRLRYKYEWHLHKRVLHELLPMLTSLQVLSLSNYENVIELPNSIEKIKHLRYLDLSSTGVRKLPDSICELCNLQVLNLSKCGKLVKLPRKMWKLINLRYLNIIETSIKEMPMQFGRLKCLQTLTQFSIGKNSGCCIAELRELKNLQGSLWIVGLQNIKSPFDAQKACLKDKKYLQELELKWDVDNGTYIQESSSLVLENLRPHTNLRRLHINCYPGKRFSVWLGLPSFSNLATVQLQHCKHCRNLPPLGQLLSLQFLSIIGFNEVVSVGPEFYGIASSIEPFKALKILTIEKMAKWEKWVLSEDENRVGAFPQLEELCIKGCPKLTELHVYLPPLAKLVIDGCPQLTASLLRAPKVTRLEIKGLDALKSFAKDGFPSEIEFLNIQGCGKLESLPEEMMNSNNCLQKLHITDCSSLMSLPNDGLSTLKELYIKHCAKLELLPEGLKASNKRLEKLRITGCSSLMSLPKDGLPVTLKELYIRHCGKLELLPKGMTNSNNSLQKLCIIGCSSLKSFPEDVLPSGLKELFIQDCGKLESLPEKMKHFNTCLEKLRIDDCSSLKFLPAGGLPPSLIVFQIARCTKLEQLPEKGEYPSLEYLCLWSCDSLETVAFDSFPVLHEIDIRSCHKLESLTVPENVESPGHALSSVEVVRSLADEMPILCSVEQMLLANCPKLERIFKMVLPTNLKSIKIDYNMAEKVGWHLLNLETLKDLRLSGKFSSVKSFPEERELPSRLTILQIISFPNLESLENMRLKHLIFLGRLHIVDCPKLKYMTSQELPPSFSILKVCDCPLLKKQWQNRKGKEWSKITGIEQKWLDFEMIE